MSCRTATLFFSGSMFKNKSNHNRFLKFVAYGRFGFVVLRPKLSFQMLRIKAYFKN